MSAAEQQLYLIFTFYSVRGNPWEPQFLTKQQFVKLCADCRLMRGRVGRADCEVLFSSIVSQKRRGIEHRKMTFPDFAEALLQLAGKLYRAVEVSDAFARLIRDDVLPRARRRAVESVDDFVSDEDTVAMLQYTGPSLDLIFQYYASQLDNDVRQPRGESFDDAASVATSATTATSAAAASWRGSANRMKLMMGHRNFMRLMADFHITDLVPAWDISDKYLASTKAVGNDRAPKIGFEDFWECLCRLALSAYGTVSTPRRNKLRALLLHMAHHVSHSWTSRGNRAGSQDATDTHDLMQGGMDFQKRIDAMWARDGHRDYLAPVEKRRESAVDLLAGMSIKDSAPGKAGAGKSPMEAWRSLAAEPVPSPAGSVTGSPRPRAMQGLSGLDSPQGPRPVALDALSAAAASDERRPSLGGESAAPAPAPTVSSGSPTSRRPQAASGSASPPRSAAARTAAQARWKRLRRDSSSLLKLPSAATDEGEEVPSGGSKWGLVSRHMRRTGLGAAMANGRPPASPGSWERSPQPASPQAGAAASPVHPPPPPPPAPGAGVDLDNWIAAVDPASGKRYYYHRETRETRWSVSA